MPPLVLDLPAPEVTRLLREGWGLDAGKMTSFGSELSTVFRIETSEGVLAAKVSRDDPGQAAVLDWRVAAMEHLRLSAAPVAPVWRTLGDEAILRAGSVEGPVAMLVTDWLTGRPLEDGTPSRRLLRSVGRTAARVASSLSDWPNAPASVSHPWELTRTRETIETALAQVEPGDVRDLVLEAVRRFDRDVTPRIGDLPRSVIHHDLHDSNLLVDGDEVSGILDFDDMVEAPRVAELVVSAAYASRCTDDPPAAIVDVCTGWGTSVKLESEEIDVVYSSALGRLATNAAVWAARAASGRGEYAAARSGKTRGALGALMRADERDVTAALTTALT